MKFPLNVSYSPCKLHLTILL